MLVQWQVFIMNMWYVLVHKNIIWKVEFLKPSGMQEGGL